MNTREISRVREERNQKVAMCSRTFFNLNGKLPGMKEMVSWLGEDYLLDIMRFLQNEIQAHSAKHLSLCVG